MPLALGLAAIILGWLLAWAGWTGNSVLGEVRNAFSRGGGKPSKKPKAA